MNLLIALAMAAAVSTVSLGALIGIGIFAIVDQRGRRRAGKRRVRSQRTTASSRGHRPYRSGRVRL